MRKDEPRGRRVTVFGGTGFVGRRLCADLAAAGAEVLSVARRPPAGPYGYGFRALDLGGCAVAELTALLEDQDPDIVVNATGSIWGLTEDQMERSCAEPARRLVGALLARAAETRAGARATRRPRLVHLGSVLEYGPIERSGRTHPSLPARPDSAYGRAKLAATDEVLSATRTGALDATVLRLANVAGPGTPAISLLGRVAARLADPATAEPVIELTALEAYRDYVDVRDVAEAVIRAFDAPVLGRVLDIGRGEAVSVRSLVRLLIEVSGRRAELVETPGSGGGRGEWICVDPEPAQRLLGWTARHSPVDSLSALWDECRAGTDVRRGLTRA